MVENYFKDRELYLIDKVRNLEKDYLEYLKIINSFQNIKNAIDKSLAACIEKLQTYSNSTKEVKVNRKELLENYKILNDISVKLICLMENQYNHDHMSENKYLKCNTKYEVINSYEYKNASILNLINVRLLDDKLLNFYSVSCQLVSHLSEIRDTNNQYFVDHLISSLRSQMKLIEVICKETLEINFMFPINEIDCQKICSYESNLQTMIEASNNVKDIIKQIQPQIINRQTEINEKINENIKKLKEYENKYNVMLKKKRCTSSLYVNSKDIFVEKFNSDVALSFDQLSDKFHRLKSISKNNELKSFLSECQLCMPILESFLENLLIDLNSTM